MSVRRVYDVVRWYLRELTGEARYDHYLDRHQLAHPGVPAMPRPEFERQCTDRGDASPRSRCC